MRITTRATSSRARVAAAVVGGMVVLGTVAGTGVATAANVQPSASTKVSGKITACVSKATGSTRVVTKTAKAHPKDVETPARSANRYQPTQLAGAATVAPVSTPATAETTTCLTKEYLDTGAVLFKDVCTQEWAMNSTNVSNKLSVVGRSCLTKDNAQDGVILFKDVCTQEWAMNTVEQAVAR